jgi:hypothetical protein
LWNRPSDADTAAGDGETTLAREMCLAHETGHFDHGSLALFNLVEERFLTGKTEAASRLYLGAQRFLLEGRGHGEYPPPRTAQYRDARRVVWHLSILRKERIRSNEDTEERQNLHGS